MYKNIVPERGLAMSIPTELDDKTLALLLTISDLCGQSDSAKHIVGVFTRSLEKAREYRDEDQPSKRRGF
jgi:hypothetical protein